MALHAKKNPFFQTVKKKLLKKYLISSSASVVTAVTHIYIHTYIHTYTLWFVRQVDEDHLIIVLMGA